MKVGIYALAEKGMARGKVLVISGWVVSLIVVLVVATGFLFSESVNEVLNLYPTVIAGPLLFVLGAGAVLGPNLVMIGLFYRDSSAPYVSRGELQ